MGKRGFEKREVFRKVDISVQQVGTEGNIEDSSRRRIMQVTAKGKGHLTGHQSKGGEKSALGELLIL